MGWKEFLRPSIKKILLTALIFLGVSLFVPIIPVYEIVVCDLAPCYPMPGYQTIIQVVQNLGWIDSVMYVPLLLELIGMYLVSCAVAAVYNRRE